MVTSNKVVREGYKITELGEIPGEWELVKLESLTDVITKGTSPSTYGYGFVDNGINFLKVESLSKSNKIIRTNVGKISVECHEKLSRSQIQCDDLLISIAGTLGRLCIVEKEYLPANTNQALAIVRLQNKKMRDYIYYALQSPHIEKTIKKIATTGAQPNLSLKQVGGLNILLPGVKEQQKIAEILSIVDEQIENTEQLIEKTKELKKGLMQQLLTKGIGHTEFKQTELGEIPLEWETVKVKNISELITKGTTPSTLGYHFLEEGINFIRSENISGYGKIKGNFAKISSECHSVLMRSQIKENDILVSIVGTIGKSAIVLDKHVPANTNQNVAIVRIGNKMANPEFVNLMYQSEMYKKYVKMETTTAVQPSMSLKQVGDFLIPLPSIEEQQTITSILSSLDEQIEIYEQENEKYLELKKGLMQQLLTGKIRVTV